MEKDVHSGPESLVGTNINKYNITRYINSGSFGNVYEAVDKTTGIKYALKVPIRNDTKDAQASILQEYRVYSDLSNLENGIPNMKITKYNENKIIVMDLLGESIETLVAKHKKFGMKTILSLGIRMLDIIRHIHNYGYIHRDIKPDNFVLGYEDESTLYCIDFGLAKKYVNECGDHIDYSIGKKRFVGTARYASVNAHRGQELSRRDDLECIGYILVYLYKGKLPWQGIKHKDKRERNILIGKKKEKTSIEELCDGMPKEFLKYFYYVKYLEFNEKPHYSALKKMFNQLFKSRGYSSDKLEWKVRT